METDRQAETDRDGQAGRQRQTDSTQADRQRLIVSEASE